MSNELLTDNIMNSRSIVADNSSVHWGGAAEGRASLYVRGTVQLGDGSDDGHPTVGRIESCSFSEMGAEEELPDGACGVEVYDAYELGWKCDITARFRAGDAMPRKNTIFTIKVPESSQEGGDGNLPLRFVVTGEPTVTWGLKDLRKVKFAGKIHNSMLRSDLVTARLRADGSTTSVEDSAFPADGFGDAPPVENAFATGLLTSTGVNVTDADTTTIGSTVYRYKTVMAAAYDVQIGTNAAHTLENLKAAVNLTGVLGTNYYAGTAIHPTVTAGALTSTTLGLTAKTAGTAGNSIATTKSAATLSFGAATLTGGT